MPGSIDATRRTFTDLAALLRQALLGALAEAEAAGAARSAEPLALTIADKQTELLTAVNKTPNIRDAAVICAASVRRGD